MRSDRGRHGCICNNDDFEVLIGRLLQNATHNFEYKYPACSPYALRSPAGWNNDAYQWFALDGTPYSVGAWNLQRFDDGIDADAVAVGLNCPKSGIACVWLGIRTCRSRRWQYSPVIQNIGKVGYSPCPLGDAQDEVVVLRAVIARSESTNLFDE